MGQAAYVSNLSVLVLDEALKPPIIKFTSEIISYKDDFPMLEDLEVMADFENSSPILDNFAEAFLPLGLDEWTKCSRMRRVEINIPNEWIKSDNLKWGEKFLDKFKR